MLVMSKNIETQDGSRQKKIRHNKQNHGLAILGYKTFSKEYCRLILELQYRRDVLSFVFTSNVCLAFGKLLLNRDAKTPRLPFNLPVTRARIGVLIGLLELAGGK